MQVVICQDPQEVTRRACDLVQEMLAENPRLVMALPAGRTPLAFYGELAGRKLDFSHARSFNLDEYVGLGHDHPGSFSHYMHENFFRHVELAQHFLPNGLAEDLALEAAEYEDAIRAVEGLDIAILGLGTHGHIAFNEPSSSLASRTRVMALHPSTRQANRAGFADGQVPTHGITMGIGTILEARRILLLAHGQSKASILRKAVEGPVTSMVPASALQLHPRVTVLVDDEAASELELQDYFRSAYP